MNREEFRDEYLFLRAEEASADVETWRAMRPFIAKICIGLLLLAFLIAYIGSNL